jgi:hypothetical protein
MSALAASAEADFLLEGANRLRGPMLASEALQAYRRTA